MTITRIEESETLNLTEANYNSTAFDPILKDRSTDNNLRPGVHILPPEILLLIFREVSSGLSFHWPPSHVKQYEKSYEPWKLSRVCSLWRTIVKADPSLWNHALLVFGRGHGEKIESLTWWMKNLLVPDHPITLRILTSSVPEIHPDVNHAVFRPLSPWIRHLEMDSVESFLQMSLHSLPQLEQLDLQFKRAFSDDMSFPLSSCHIEHLRIFRINFIYGFHERFMRDIPVPWGNLTYLHISFHANFQIISIPSALEVLKKCTNLRRCSIDIAASVETNPTMMIVELPHLFALTFFHSQLDKTCRYSLIESLVTPALKDLVLSRSNNMFEFHPNIGSFVRRSGCQLDTLTIRGSGFTLTDDDLEALSSIHTLKVPKIRLSPSTLRKIDEGILLPNIKRFEYLKGAAPRMPAPFVDVDDHRQQPFGQRIRFGGVLLPPYSQSSPYEVSFQDTAQVDGGILLPYIK
ncbi:hypothetical protein H0H93_009214 [Arthromyces matolae]|nr:hypothetical protein H0H93_009214 [Arthromyces matolae]